MACSNCTPLKALANCGTSIGIGKAPLANTQYNIYLEDLATGRIQVATVTSDASKDLLLPMSSFVILSKHTYKIWITNAGGSEAEWQPVVLSGDTHECFYQVFEDKFENGYMYDFPLQNLYPA